MFQPEFDRLQEGLGSILQTCPRPTFIPPRRRIPAGSNESARQKQREIRQERQKCKELRDKMTLTVLRSGLYPLLAWLAAIPSVLRAPERLRSVEVDLPVRTVCGDVLVLRVVIWMPEPESLMSMVCECVVRINRVEGKCQGSI